MIKRFLAVLAASMLVVVLGAGGATVTAGEDPGVSDDPTSSCAAGNCW